jgi:anthranilate phosphoribosyltransferase/anthranilate synthase/phosphoribosyltransferase
MTTALKPVLARLAAGACLSAAEAEAAFAQIMDGLATPAQIAALLTAMRVRGETPDELLGAVRAVRARMLPIAVPPGTIDVCGTGGDGHCTLNVSTAVAFVVAACGVNVAKHGNRALSSLSGGADVLAALGVDVPPSHASEILARTGLTFLFAPNHHPALRHAALPRAELGFRTLLNLVGPAANPAGVRHQLIGVFAPRWLTPMAETLGALGAERVWVVHGAGLDELTLAGETQVLEYRAGTLRHFTIMPEEAGLPCAPISAIAGGNAASNAAALRALLDGAPGPYRDTVVLNAAAALVVAGRVDTLIEGAALAGEALRSFAARGLLTRLQDCLRTLEQPIPALD